jgi:hypothetical protein
MEIRLLQTDVRQVMLTKINADFVLLIPVRMDFQLQSNQSIQQTPFEEVISPSGLAKTFYAS